MAHTDAALAHLREPRGAIDVLRVWSQREWVPPAFMAAQLARLEHANGIPAMRRALVDYITADEAAQRGDSAAVETSLARLAFVTHWLVAGPFDNDGRNGFVRELGPEHDRGAVPDPATAYEGKERPVHWRALPDVVHLGYVPLGTVVRPSADVCAFAHTTVVSASARPAVLWLGAAGQIAAWVNGAEVFRDAAVRGAFPDRSGVRVSLHRGPNRVLVKVCNTDRELAFYARFTRPDGVVLDRIAVDADPSVAPEQVAASAVSRTDVLGDLHALERAAEAAHAGAEAAEQLARYLRLTAADDATSPAEPDLARRAATMQPTVDRWLLVRDLETDRNRRREALDAALALDPRDVRTLTAYAHEKRTGTAPDDARAWLDRALESDPSHLATLIEDALLLDDQGLSLTSYTRLHELDARTPGLPGLINATSAAAEHAQRYDDVLALRRRYLAMRDDDASMHLSIARDARQRGDRETVRHETERALAVEPAQLDLYAECAELLEASGEGEMARGVMARATEIAPDEPASWRTLGELEVRLAHRDDGRADLRRALGLRPQDRDVQRYVESLEPPVPRPDEALAEESESFLARRVEGHGAGDYKLRSLAELTVRTVFENGLSATFRQTAFQVMTRDGADDSQTFPVTLDPDTQRFELRRARVYHRDGSVDESAGLEEYSLTGGASRMYYDARAMVISLPRLVPGDVVEIRWRVDDVAGRNAFSDYFGDLHVMQNEVPRARERYVLRAPAGRTFNFHVPSLPGLVREDRVEESTKIYSFEARDVPAVVPEDHAPGTTERAAYLHVSTYGAWQDVGRWYWGLVSNQLHADEHVRRIVTDATRNAHTPVEKVRAVYDWVSQRTRYVALEFGIHGFLPYRVTDVCTRGFGDCKDKASTIVTMLREVGIDASLVLVRTRHNGAVATAPASLAVFDHAIAYAPPMEGYPDGIFLDGTAQHAGMDELPPEDQGAMALVVDQHGGARLVTLPTVPANRNTWTVRTTLDVAADGAATMHATHELSGPNAPELRQALESSATRSERVERWFGHAYPGIRVTSVTTSALDEVERPARAEFDATVPTVGTRQGDTLLLPLAAPLNLTREFAGRSQRTADVVMGAPQSIDEQRTVHLPPGATVTDLPAAVRFDTPFVRLVLESERAPGGFTVHRHLEYVAPRVAAHDYGAFRDALQRVDDALSHRVTVQLAPAGGAR